MWLYGQTSVWMNEYLLFKNQSKMKGQKAWVTLKIKNRHKDLLQTYFEDSRELWVKLMAGFLHFSRVENLGFHKAFLFLLHII